MSWKQTSRNQSRLAQEKNRVPVRPGGRIRIALAFANTYRLGMSNLGFQVVYQLLNRLPHVSCERVFYPDADLLADFRSGRERLQSLESGRPVSDFHLLAFSVPFENDYANLLEMIRFSGLPLKAQDRREEHPLVAVGGVAAFLNPEPLAPFVDLVFVGEAEGLLSAFVEKFQDGLRSSAISRREFLEGLAADAPGIYVPRFYEPRFAPDGLLQGFRRKRSLPKRIRAARAPDLNDWPAQSAFVCSETEFSETALIEIGRGCGRGCRFCAAGFIYRPPRFRSAETVVQAASRWEGAAKRVGLVSAAVADHPQVDRLCRELLAQGFQLTFSSLRADRLSPEILQSVGKSALKSVAIAPEAGSERLRRVINKDLEEAQILEAAERLTQCGILHLKLYFMIGLPTETLEDLEAIAALVKKIKHHVLEKSRGRKRIGTITVSIHSFVPKPFTPFQWAPFAGVGPLKEKAKWIRRALGKVANVRVHFDLAKWAYVQALLARGDRRVAWLLEKVAGEGLSWTQAFKKSPHNPDFWVLRERDPHEVFPWEILDHGIKRSYLWAEYEKAREGTPTQACDTASRCTRCGVCLRAAPDAEAPKGA
ncbi:Radical SAM superfamily enzyme YgiQ, UPF0313 family [Desulfacinum hydrothermale DSM 13146]|uniref:Radical SAM superfamily enzyme YgiQ, UPF0313 family n=1 Tax=Desulfacinum hydrothermale DSM 13146 TaxID=1121390 RepID=A0A1W1XAC5_9BACT|nr:radical SAM protein [Desulfacinum hydrothermale]SMC20965.1 Radical SAM superfamily enzyme YgiQ, UPF0313 family [Desulfacinum hydrothermale DSM 13146]